MMKSWEVAQAQEGGWRPVRLYATKATVMIQSSVNYDLEHE